MSRELLQQALDTLKSIEALHLDSMRHKLPETSREAERQMDRVVATGNQSRVAIAALQAELAKPPIEPVAWMVYRYGCRAQFSTDPMTPIIGDTRPDHTVTPLYAGEPLTKEGFVLVPVEPTRKMLDAGHLDLTLDYGVDTMLKYAWSQMIEAAKEQK